MRVIVAGFGALAFMRLRLAFPVGGGGETLVGPGQTIDSILAANLGYMQAQVDATLAGRTEELASKAARNVSEAMQGLTYADVGDGKLVSICMGLLNAGVTEVPQKLLDLLDADIEGLEAAPDMDDSVRCLLLGLSLYNILGHGILKAALETIPRPAPANPNPNPNPGPGPNP